MRVQLFLISLVMIGGPALAQVVLHKAQPLNTQKTVNSYSPTIQVIHFPNPREFIRGFDLGSNSFYLVKGALMSMAEANQAIANQTTTVCQVNVSQPGLSNLTLGENLKVKSIAYFKETTSSGELRSLQASIDVDSDVIFNLIVTRTVSEKFLTALEKMAETDPRKNKQKENLKNFLVINAQALTSCFGTPVEIQEILRPN